MYKYNDTKRDIPNTFDPVSANKFFSIPIIIHLISRGRFKREDLPENVLKRVDAEIKYIRETQVDDVLAELDRKHKILEEKIKENKPISE